MVIQFLIIAATYAATELIAEGLLAFAADRARNWLTRAGKQFNRACGLTFIVIGIALPLRA